MPIDRIRLIALPLTGLGAAMLLAGCQQDFAEMGRPQSTFGEANRQTMMAQVVDPDPQYEFLDPATSGDHAAKAIDRYRKDAVKKPERIKSTEGSGGSGGGGGS